MTPPAHRFGSLNPQNPQAVCHQPKRKVCLHTGFWLNYQQDSPRKVWPLLDTGLISKAEYLDYQVNGIELSRERSGLFDAEGATAPETLRQKDRDK
jgi:hypothetical protein